MNLTLDEIEKKSFADLEARIGAIETLNGKRYECHFKLYPGSIGFTIVFVCEELGIEKDITNYNNW